VIPLSAQQAWFDRHADEIPDLIRAYLTPVVMGELVELARKRLTEGFGAFGDAMFWKTQLRLIGFDGEAPQEGADLSLYLLAAVCGHELREEYEDTITHRIVAPPIEELCDEPD
jgi:hypothetical protein